MKCPHCHRDIGVLAHARMLRGLTQEQIAERLGVSQTTVSDWETGAAVPRPPKWAAIADAYGLRFNRLASVFAAGAA